jgi:hypothetical protein
MSDDELDVLAIQRDDELLDALGARQPMPAFAGDDLVAGLLASLNDEVDEGVGPPLPSFYVPVRSSIQEVPRARRVGRRTIVGLGVAGVVFSASGVAAAVTGDPFAPIKKVVTAVTDTPSGTTRDQVDRELRQAGEALDKGDRPEAREQLEAAREKAKKLKGADAVAAMEQVKELEKQLGIVTPAPTDGGTPGQDPALPAVPPGNGDPTKSDKELRQDEKERERAERQRQKEQKQKEREERRKKEQEETGGGGDNGRTNPTATPSPSPSTLQNLPLLIPATN